MTTDNTQPTTKPDFKEVAKLILTNDSDFIWERIGHTGEYKKLHLDSRNISVIERLYNSPAALSAMGLVKKEDYAAIENEVAKAYDHVTRGRFCKWNTDAGYIIDEHERIIRETVKEYVELLLSNQSVKKGEGV